MDRTGPSSGITDNERNDPFESSHAKRRILIADDDKVIADSLSIILRKGGFETAAVYGGRKAVDLAQQFRPDVLISDVMMPDLNGIEAATRIRAMLPSCRIILCSGQAGSDLTRKARMHRGEFEILAKPIHPGKLIDHLRKIAVGFVHPPDQSDDCAQVFGD